MKNFQNLTKKIRLNVLEMIYLSKQSHIGSCFSVVEILILLYFQILKAEDKFFLSKGHAAPALYTTLVEKGILSASAIQGYGKNGLPFQIHSSSHLPGVEFSSGSLGQLLSVSVGVALAARCDKKSTKIYTLLSDGELQEGSNWEAILFSGQKKLNNLTAIIDYNKSQALGNVEDICSLEPLKEKLQSFGWDVFEVNGHEFSELDQAFSEKGERPKAIIAHTIKGKGVSFMENQLLWHYKNPSLEEYKEAREEILRL